MPPLARLKVVVVRDRWFRFAPPPVMHDVTASAVIGNKYWKFHLQKQQYYADYLYSQKDQFVIVQNIVLSIMSLMSLLSFMSLTIWLIFK
jgi:hypothetical protein